MLKKMMTQVLVLAMILLLFGSDALSQTRISFRRGSTSASVSGNLAPGAERRYVLTARSGQRLNARISSGNRQVIFGDAGEAIITTNYFVTKNGDNELVVLNNGNKATKFTLTVSIR